MLARNAQNPFPAPATPDGTQRITGTCSESDTLRLVTGNLIKTVSVANIPTVGRPLVFTLTYNAQDTGLGPVGHKWRHNLMARLIIDSGYQFVILRDSSGRNYTFLPDGSGGWYLPGSCSYFASFDSSSPTPPARPGG